MDDDELARLAEGESAPQRDKNAEHAGAIASLKAKYKYIAAWDLVGHGLIVCRRMRRTELLTFTKASNAANKRYDADGDPSEMAKVNETVVKTMCVWPENRELLTEVFNEYPTFSTTAALAISRLGEEGVTELGKE